ncbi:hypothetical protein BH10ACT9_BH10ACT9_27770 [soil metagenome]
MGLEHRSGAYSVFEPLSPRSDSVFHGKHRRNLLP